MAEGLRGGKFAISHVYFEDELVLALVFLSYRVFDGWQRTPTVEEQSRKQHLYSPIHHGFDTVLSRLCHGFVTPMFTGEVVEKLRCFCPMPAEIYTLFLRSFSTMPTAKDVPFLLFFCRATHKIFREV